MRSFDTPVAIVLFNRPDRVAELVEALRPSKPRRIFAIADGPRAGHDTDRDRCARARETLDSIDWPCEIVREYSSTNLGCDERIERGLDWLFERVERAIILEDDIRPAPRFLPWAASMLDRYGDDEEFSIASGRNTLGAWGHRGADHLRARRGSIWGWATTARSWRRSRTLDLAAFDPGEDGCFGLEDLDPLLAEHFRTIVAEAGRHPRLAWDTSFSVRTALDGRLAAVSSVNLIANAGVGADATRTTFEGDFVARLPALDHPPGHGAVPSELDPRYDRWSLLAELLGRCVKPEAAIRLAQLVKARPDAPIEASARLHLAPFLHPKETLEILDRLSDLGLGSDRLDAMRSALRRLADGATA